MNLAFALLVILALVVIWFLAAGSFKVIGRVVWKVGSDAMDNLSRHDDEEEELEEQDDAWNV